MDLADLIPFIFQSLLGLIPALLILAATVYYTFKRPAVDGYLMAMGSLISMVTQTFYSLGIPILRQMGMDVMAVYDRFSIPVGIMSILGHLMFAVGLFLLIFKTVKAPVSTNDPSGY